MEDITVINTVVESVLVSLKYRSGYDTSLLLVAMRGSWVTWLVIAKISIATFNVASASMVDIDLTQNTFSRIVAANRYSETVPYEDYDLEERDKDLHRFEGKNAMRVYRMNVGRDYPTIEPVDRQRMLNPLLKQSSTASIGLLFILLLWRTLSCFEMADQFQSAQMRTLTLLPAIILSCANALGFMVNLIKPLNFKNHLKAILAINLLREAVEILYNIVAMLRTSQREIYLGRFFINCWWLLLCYSFSKSRWVLDTELHNIHYDYDPHPPNGPQYRG